MTWTPLAIVQHLLSDAVSFLECAVITAPTPSWFGWLLHILFSSLKHPSTTDFYCIYLLSFSLLQETFQLFESGDFVSLMSASCIAYAVLLIRPHMDNRYSKIIHWMHECRVNSWGQHDTLKIIYLKGTELFFSNDKYIWYNLVVYYLIILRCHFSLQFHILTYSEWYS